MKNRAIILLAASAFTTALPLDPLVMPLVLTIIMYITGIVAAVTYVLVSNASRRRQLMRKKKVIIVVSSVAEYESAHDQLLEELNKMRVLGLDCEWNTDESRRRVSMLQLCTQTGYCLLVRLHLLANIPPQLQQLLADRNVLKFGVGICGDASYLYKDYGLVLVGCVDLRHVYMRTKRTRYPSSMSLSGLAEAVLGVKMDKSIHIRCSDWEASTLSRQQIDYAAQDGLVAADMLTELVLSKMSSARRSSGQFDRLLTSLVQGVLDLDYREKDVRRAAKKPPVARVKEKASTAYKSRNGPLYENAQLHAPDGQLLCTCSTSKAKWYVEKGIGEYVDTEPLTVRLLFEPSGRPDTTTNYYTLDKDNICVVCGAADSHIRKHIVPKEYRRFFPTIMKEHKSHDILLLCIPCHQRSGVHDALLRQRWAGECDAPIASGAASRFTLDKDLDSVRSAARALLKSRDRIPSDRLDVLESRIREYYQLDPDHGLDKKLLMDASELSRLTENEAYVPHGIKVVRHVMEHGGLIYFERTWRQHFLDNMQPKFLPEMWRVDHNHKKLEQFDKELRTNANLREEILSSFEEC